VNHVNSESPRGTPPDIRFPPHYEIDIITGQAFNSAGDVIDAFTSDLRTPALAGPGIVRTSFSAFETAFLLGDSSFTIVPEPGTGMLLMLGLTLSASLRRPTKVRS